MQNKQLKSHKKEINHLTDKLQSFKENCPSTENSKTENLIPNQKIIETHSTINQQENRINQQENIKSMSKDKKEKEVIVKRADDSGAIDLVVNQLSQKITQLEADFSALQTSVVSQTTSLISGARGSSYVRWGHSQCVNGSEMVYSGNTIF